MSRLGDMVAAVSAERERFLRSALNSFGAAVKRERTRKGMTQADLAALVGLSRVSITNIEAGRQDTPISQAALIAEVLDTTLAVLVQGVDR